MKKWILFVACLMVTSKSISQTVTKSESKTTVDSLVCIPKSLAIRVIEDLERGDLDSATVTILRDDLLQKDSIIFVKDSVIAKQKRTIALCEQSVGDCGEIDDLNQRTIKNLNIKLNRETKKKKAWRIIAGGFAFLAILVAK